MEMTIKDHQRQQLMLGIRIIESKLQQIKENAIRFDDDRYDFNEYSEQVFTQAENLCRNVQLNVKNSMNHENQILNYLSKEFMADETYEQDLNSIVVMTTINEIDALNALTNLIAKKLVKKNIKVHPPTYKAIL